MYHPVPSFAFDRQLMSIELLTGLTSLGDGAFSGCSSMMSIELPACLTSLSAGAPSLAPRVLVGSPYVVWVKDAVRFGISRLNATYRCVPAPPASFHRYFEF